MRNSDRKKYLKFLKIKVPHHGIVDIAYGDEDLMRYRGMSKFISELPTTALAGLKVATDVVNSLMDAGSSTVAQAIAPEGVSFVAGAGRQSNRKSVLQELGKVLSGGMIRRLDY